MEFEWDEEKRWRNRNSHGVDFPDAEPAFFDPLALEMEDPDSEGEQRHVRIGRGFGDAVLVVVYTWRGSRARVISVRKATRTERRQYEGE